MAHKQIRTLPEGTCLDSFIQLHIQAPHDFVVSAQNCIDTVVRILQGSSFPYNVAKVLKTGSLGQGVALKDNLSDIDLVVYLNNYTEEDITTNIEQILTNMHKALKSLPGYIYLSMDEFRLGIRLQAQGQTFDVDLLPGILKKKKKYRRLYRIKDPLTRKHYSLTFAKLQKRFIKTRMTKLKNLFQLIKYWSKVDLKILGGGKIKSYLISLIVIHTWEEYGQPQDFKTEIGFKAVLKTLINYQQLHKVWFDNYDSTLWQRFGEPKRPYLIDPSDPSNNILNTVQNWDIIVQAAKCTVDSPLLRSIHISRNWQYPKKKKKIVPKIQGGDV